MLNALSTSTMPSRDPDVRRNVPTVPLLSSQPKVRERTLGRLRAACHKKKKKHILRRTTYLDLTLRACSVGTSPASLSSHLGIASLYYLADLCSGSLFFPFLLALSVRFLFFLLSFRVRACAPNTAPRARAAGVVGVSGWWRVEGGSQGARSPFWGLL